MILRHRRFVQISKLFPCVFKGTRLRQPTEAMDFWVSSIVPVTHSCENRINNRSFVNRMLHCQRYSTMSQVSSDSSLPAEADSILSFIEFSFNELQGPNHCWLNMDEESMDALKKDGIFLVLAGRYLENSQIVHMLEKVKSLQQSFSQLSVMGFHFGNSSSAVEKTCLVELIMKEYITFPILLSDKISLQMESEACYILFKGFRNPVIYHEKGLNSVMLNKAIEALRTEQNGNINNGSSRLHNLKSIWVKHAEFIKEPHIWSSLQNLLFSFPGCISADESGDRLFLSDSNHHRVIIFNGSGKILDCIGSCPGFEDGEFESAKLVRPAGSFYHDSEDCLYIVDSENHAIRRADLERRVLETLYPVSSINDKNNTVWAWILNKLGFGRKVDLKSENFDSQALVLPWHLLKLEEDDFLVINRSFETLWIMDVASGYIRKEVKGFPRIMEAYGQLIMEKISLLKQMPSDWLQRQSDVNCSSKGLLHASLISSLATFENDLVMCDTVAQRLLKLNRDSGALTNLQLSNFGILGFPYWLCFPVEGVYSGTGPHGAWIAQVQRFSLLPGRIDIQLNIDLPVDVELVEPLQEECIWRQARGAATKVLGAEGVVGSSEKVGVAQQWYDELDNLAFTAGSEVTVEDSNAISSSEMKSQDDRVHIACSVNTSPGTSEVIIFAALYLKLRGRPDIQEDVQEQYAERITDILQSGRHGGMGRDSYIQLLLKSNNDLRALIFLKPLHVRIKFDTPDHPKADNSKDIILTDTSIEVNVSL